MAYTLLSDNPLAPQPNPDVIITYNNDTEQFSVHSPNSLYTVNRSTLISDTCKYQNEVISQLLRNLPDDKDFTVFVNNIAQNSIHLVCEANRLLY